MSAPSKKSNQKQKSQPEDNAFDKTRFSLSNPSSQWVLVNKTRPLEPKDFVPGDLVTPNVPLRVPGNDSMQLRKEAAIGLESLFAAAKSNNTPLMLSSGYRSYDFQTYLYDGYVRDEGQVVADKVSARPGYSEHQTGLSVDIEPLDQQCDVSLCFADLPAGKWLATQAYIYGFILRYPSGKTTVTGYSYEPWHFRFVGKPLAAEMRHRHIATLEEFFGIGAAPDYQK